MLAWRFGTPPIWLRHVMPWRLLEWIDRHFHVCWTAVATWKLNHFQHYPRMAWGDLKDCRPDCYCGKYEAL